MTPPEADGLARAADHLRAAKRALVITGAGLSADSGLPTYRGVGGLYDREVTDEGLPIEDVLSGSMFRRNPELCWKYMAEIELARRGKTFNEGHRALAQLEAHLDVWILTQNVDGFHKQAGSSRVIDIHGDISTLFCPSCDHRVTEDSYASMTMPPKCPQCSAYLRPDVVLFGENLPMEKLHRLDTEKARGFDVVMVVGTSAVFPYIAAPVLEAANRGLPTIEINPGRSQITDAVQLHLPMRAAEALTELYARVNA